MKLTFTFLFAVIFLISFIAFDGRQYFYTTTYANNFNGFNFQVHCIDVGQGDCFLIKLPNKKCMMIDAGKEEYGNLITEYVQQFMYQENIKQIDYLMLSHPDSDHVGGAKTLLNNFKVVSLLRPPVYSYSESQMQSANKGYSIDASGVYDDLIMRAYEKNVYIEEVYQGMTFDFGGCYAEILSPTLDTYYNSNNFSVVMMLTMQSKKFLFVGDAEEKIEKQLISTYGNKLKADVLKVGHHGSITSSSQEFIEMVSPEYALISSGGNSSYFPNKTVLSRLKNISCEVVSTYDKGSFVFAIENQNIIYEVAKRPPNYLALIFAVTLMVVLVAWENPFKRYKLPNFVKNSTN